MIAGPNAGLNGETRMSLLDRLFGGRGGSAVDTAALVSNVVNLYDDPEAQADRGLSITGRGANELRDLGRKLHKAGGHELMVAARDALRAKPARRSPPRAV